MSWNLTSELVDKACSKHSIQKTTRVSFLEPLLQSMACIGETTVVSLHCQLSLAPLLQSMAVVLHPQ